MGGATQHRRDTGAQYEAGSHEGVRSAFPVQLHANAVVLGRFGGEVQDLILPDGDFAFAGDAGAPASTTELLEALESQDATQGGFILGEAAVGFAGVFGGRDQNGAHGNLACFSGE